MAILTINIPDPVATRVLTGFSAANGYQPTVPDGQGGTVPNPETRAQFCRRKLAEYVKATVQGWEANAAAHTAAQAAAAAADSELSVT